MSKHTPGPWRRQGAIIWGAEIARAVAKVVTQKGEPHQDNANAKLISAAPDLLVALKKCLPKHRDGDCYSDDYMGVCVCGREAAASAIAKAEGK